MTPQQITALRATVAQLRANLAALEAELRKHPTDQPPSEPDVNDNPS